MKSILKFLLLAWIASTGVSCLDLDPQAQLSDAQVWNKATNFRLFANQFYGWTRDFQGSTTVTYMNGFVDGPHADTRSDLLCASSVNVFSAGTNSIPATDDNYNNLYKRLYYTNLLLSHAAAYPNQQDIAESKGEALFFRAYLHFELVQLYGDCILLQKPLDIDSRELTGPRTDRLEVIRAAVQDLKDAAALLPETPSEDGRVCRYTAWALLSRVALYEGTWQKFHNNAATEAAALLGEAVDAAGEVIGSKKYELFYSDKLGGADSYRYLFLLEDVQCNPAGLTKSANKEYIFSRRHDEVLKRIGTNVTHGAQNNAYYVTRKLADMYRCQDGLPISLSPKFQGYSTATSEFTDRDNRMNGTLLRNGQACWNNDGKWRTSWNDDDLSNSLTANTRVNSGYANNKWATERQVADANEGYDYPIIRYAEVLLNYAEALYELNGSISDEELEISLNEVRKRSNPTMTPLSNKLVTDHGLSMREEIRAERTVELFFEGFRIDDLKRWKTAEVEMPKDLLGVQYRGTWYESNWTDQRRPLDAEGRIVLYDNRVWEKKHYLLPLPGDERQLNPALGQNPDW